MVHAFINFDYAGYSTWYGNVVIGNGWARTTDSDPKGYYLPSSDYYSGDSTKYLVSITSEMHLNPDPTSSSSKKANQFIRGGATIQFEGIAEESYLRIKAPNNRLKSTINNNIKNYSIISSEKLNTDQGTMIEIENLSPFPVEVYILDYNAQIYRPLTNPAAILQTKQKKKFNLAESSKLCLLKATLFQRMTIINTLQWDTAKKEILPYNLNVNGVTVEELANLVSQKSKFGKDKLIKILYTTHKTSRQAAADFMPKTIPFSTYQEYYRFQEYKKENVQYRSK